MRFAYGAALLCWLAFFCAAPACADIDQHCLKQCVDNGGPSAFCMTQCSYNLPNPNLPVAPQSHRVLPTLTPMDQNQTFIAPKIVAVTPNKDYNCMSQCLQGGGSVYKSCEERCSIIPCPPGGDASLCRTPTANPGLAAPASAPVVASPQAAH